MLRKQQHSNFINNKERHNTGIHAHMWQKLFERHYIRVLVQLRHFARK